MSRATGIGSMPGADFTETARMVLGDVGLPFLPELPARGVHASMIGRALGLIEDLGADLQPDGWRIGVGQGIDQRRARSLLTQDLDVLEELAQDYTGPLKVQVTGPLTLAAAVEHPRGEKMLSDHGARRELAEALAAGVAAYVDDVTRRFPRTDVIVQVDEPGIRAVLDGAVPTASGYQSLRSIAPPEADELLRRVVDVIHAGGAASAVHTCANDVPIDLLRGIGFGALSFDLSLTRPLDVWAEAFEAGVDLWIGAVVSQSRVQPQPRDVAVRVQTFFSALGFGVDSYADRLVVTSPCGLAGLDPRAARDQLAIASSVDQYFEQTGD